jgi:hypothetical protein
MNEKTALTDIWKQLGENLNELIFVISYKYDDDLEEDVRQQFDILLAEEGWYLDARTKKSKYHYTMRKDSFSPDFRVVREKKAPFKKMLRKTKYRVKQASRSPITAVSVALVQIVSAVVLENQILLGVGIAVMCIVAFVDALLLVRLKKLLEDEWL